jgi:hypothetical protein
LWSYYGSKLKIVNKYPEPKHDTIIEPFAGAAQYSLKYYDKNVILIDKYDVIIKLWKWLQICSKKDILSLPYIELGKSVDEYSWDCEEAKWLIGFIIAAGVASPRKKPSKWRTTLRPHSQEYKKSEIADSLYKIKHWKFILGEYNCIDSINATWFIDPPYQQGGNQYKFGSKMLDYNELSHWCKERNGQTIVCENTNSNWLESIPIAKMDGVKYKTMETMWYNETT